MWNILYNIFRDETDYFDNLINQFLILSESVCYQIIKFLINNVNNNNELGRISAIYQVLVVEKKNLICSFSRLNFRLDRLFTSKTLEFNWFLVILLKRKEKSIQKNGTSQKSIYRRRAARLWRFNIFFEKRNFVVSILAL